MQYTEHERNEDFYKKNSYDIAEELNIPWGTAVVSIRKAQIMAYARLKAKQLNW